jgi:DNA polymerase-3 subunit epsilon
LGAPAVAIPKYYFAHIVSSRPYILLVSEDRLLLETTFVILDLETTGGSPANSKITEIGAVKVRGGEVIGEFQSFVNPEMAIPPFITVLTGITDAMVTSAPAIGEVFFSLLEFIGSPTDSVLVAHNAPFDIGFLKSAAEQLNQQWPRYEIVDTAKISKYALSRDEVLNFKLSTLAKFFGAVTEPDHRALSDARATVDVLHGVFERLGSQGIFSFSDLKSLSNRITEAQRKKRHLANNAPDSPGVYIFKDERNEPLYIGTSRNLKSRVRTYFSAAETRKRIHDMIGLAASLEFIETPTILEAEIEELRLIGSIQPRFNRRSRFQNKAVILRITDEDFPRISLTRGIHKLSEGQSWIGPFSSRDEAQSAQAGIYEEFSIRQCTPRITMKSMQNASPCALFDLGKCGAPCIGMQSTDTYKSVVLELQHSLERDSRSIFQRLEARMKELALTERYEEAAEVRNRLLSLIKGMARSQRISALLKINKLIVAAPSDGLYEIALIHRGRLVATRKGDIDGLSELVEDLNRISDGVFDQQLSNQISTHEEIEVLLRFITNSGIKLFEIDGEWSSPLYGGERHRERLSEFRDSAISGSYKETFSISWERSRQR